MLSNFAEIDFANLPSITDGAARAHRVPKLEATAQTLAGYGHITGDFATASVEIVTWPQPGWRPVVPGTGNEAGVVEDRFEMVRCGEIQQAVNHAVGRSYITGWYTDPARASQTRTPRSTARIFTHEANYHPDGGQIFSPRDAAPFVALLAKPGDNVTPDDFVAFHCDGSFGLHIDPGVWHQPVFPIADRAVFDGRQGRVHCCIAINFLAEFGCYLEVPLC